MYTFVFKSYEVESFGTTQRIPFGGCRKSLNKLQFKQPCGYCLGNLFVKFSPGGYFASCFEMRWSHHAGKTMFDVFTHSVL